MVIPYLVYPIPGSPGLFDIQGAYGYGGPLTNNPDPEFLGGAWNLIRDSWQKQSVVAASICSHSMLGNGSLFDQSWEVVFDRPTVSVDLTGGLESAFAGAHARNHRRDAAQVRRAGLASYGIAALHARHPRSVRPDVLGNNDPARSWVGLLFLPNLFQNARRTICARYSWIAEVRDTNDRQTRAWR